MKMIGNVSDWLSYAGGALIKVADSAGSTVVNHIKCQGITFHTRLPWTIPATSYFIIVYEKNDNQCH